MAALIFCVCGLVALTACRLSRGRLALERGGRGRPPDSRRDGSATLRDSPRTIPFCLLKLGLLLSRFEGFPRGSKNVDLWYNLNSRNTTLSIRNFNNLKSFAGGFKAVDFGAQIPAEFQGLAKPKFEKKRDVFAERDGHQRDSYSHR